MSLVRMEGSDMSDILRPVIILVKRLDKISLKNNDVFVRAYFKMLVTALPSMMSLFKFGELNLNESNDLLQMISQMAQYFFDIRFNSKDMMSA
jgi:hypothetical protein